MPEAARVGDMARCPSDAHGCPGCSHSVIGPAVSGSGNVQINGRPALRLNDPGIHAACCGSNSWNAMQGSSTVLINGMPAVRRGDMTRHCGGLGKMIEGSHNVIIGGAPTSVAPPSIREKAEIEKAKQEVERVKTGESNIKLVSSQSDPAFKIKTIAALSELASTPTGARLINELAQAGKVIEIEDARDHGQVGNSETFIGSNVIIRFNPDRKKLDGENWQQRPPSIGLGHELIHAYHDLNGTTDNGDRDYYDLTTGAKRNDPGYEVQAVGLGPYMNDPLTENNVRRDMNQPLRPHY